MGILSTQSIRTGSMRARSKRVIAGVIGLIVCFVFLVVQPVLVARAANSLTYFKAVKGTLAVGQRTEYTFDGKKGDKLTITMSVTDGGLDPYLSLYDPQGNQIGEDDNSAGK